MMHIMVEHESFDGDRYDDMPETVDELLAAAAEDEVEAVTMHELGRCDELEGPCTYCAQQIRD
jgi:hypothetical protein